MISCQTTDPWRRTFTIEKYPNDFLDLAATKVLDTFELRAFEDYLLQHPGSGQGKSYKALFLESDTFRITRRSKLIREYTADTLRFRWAHHLVPNPIDSPMQDVDFKVFLVNLSHPPISNLSLKFPEGAYRDSVWVDSLAHFDSLHLAPHDSIELYSYRVRYNNGSYMVGSSELKAPLYVSQISPPEFYVEEIQWQGQLKPPETILPCEKNEVKLSLEDGAPPTFIAGKETLIYISVPCLDRECLLTAEGSGATVKRERSKQNKWVFLITPEQAEFSLSVYSSCLPGFFIGSGKEKKSIAGRTLVQTLTLKAKKKLLAIRTEGIQ